MTTGREPWSDERVAAAFLARADHVGRPAPALAATVIGRLTAESRRPRARFRWSGAVAASVAAVLVLAAVVGLTRSRLPTTASQPPSVTTSVGASMSVSATSSSPAASPIELQAVDVSEAIRIRDTFHDGRELAVKGFLSPEPMVFCPMVLSSDMLPPVVYCPGSFLWLMETAERTVAGSTFEAPRGQAFHPSFGVIGMRTVASWPAASVDPVAAVLVGHFDDRRSSLCNSARYGGPAECRQTFVVDQIESFGGGEQSVSTSDRTTPGESIRPVASTADVDALVASVSRGQRVLSRVLLPGESLWSVEPSLRGEPEYLGARLVWIETTLDGSGAVPVSRTWLVIDGMSSVGRMTNDNQVSLALPTSRPDQTVLCGRYSLEACAATISVVRADYANEVDRAWEIAVDDACPLRAVCDRLYPFDAFVALIPDQGSAASSWIIFEAVGLGQSPERTMPWGGPVPEPILEMLAVNHPPGRLSSQSPGAS